VLKSVLHYAESREQVGFRRRVGMSASEGTTGDRLTAETLGGDVILVERRMNSGGWELGTIERLPRRRGRQAQIDRFLGRRRETRARAA
jgi:hypothetical protein